MGNKFEQMKRNRFLFLPLLVYSLFTCAVMSQNQSFHATSDLIQSKKLYFDPKAFYSFSPIVYEFPEEYPGALFCKYELDSFHLDFLSGVLEEANEPVLWNHCNGKWSLRFLYMPSFETWCIITLTQEELLSILTCAEIDHKGVKLSNYTIPLSQEEVGILKKIINSGSFYSERSTELMMSLISDGTPWLIEVCSSEEYHFVTRNSRILRNFENTALTENIGKWLLKKVDYENRLANHEMDKFNIWQQPLPPTKSNPFSPSGDSLQIKNIPVSDN